MGRGGYNGGSTLIGPGRAWSYDPDFAFRDSGIVSGQSKRERQPPVPADPTITAGSVPIDDAVLHKHRLAADRNIERNAVLIDIGRRLPKKPAERREALKRLVAEGILLQTGVINIDHPAVAAWIATDREKTDRHG